MQYINLCIEKNAKGKKTYHIISLGNIT